MNKEKHMPLTLWLASLFLVIVFMPHAQAKGNPPQHTGDIAVSELNTLADQQFLETNKQHKDIKTTASGLQYRILNPGQGTAPSAQDTVTVDYEGKLVDGTVFDSSYKRGQPATFPVSGVIQGWQEALQLMQSGATWEVFVPAELAYGTQGVPGVIPPNSALIFKIHLIAIQ